MTDDKTKRRSLIIYLPDLSGGGAETLHARLLPEFSKADIDVTFLVTSDRGELADGLRARGARIVSLQARQQIGALPRLVRFLRREKPDMLIANSEHANLVAVTARRLAGVKTRIVVTQHSVFSIQVERRPWKYRLLPPLTRLILPLADEIVAVSAGVADDLATHAHVSRQRIRVIHNGIVSAEVEETVSDVSVPPSDNNPPTVLSIGRLVELKDFATLIRAFAIVARKSDARLVILGEGPERPRLEALIGEYGLEDRVSLPGFTPDVSADLKRARLFALASRAEGFGNVIAEALACGTPVVSTDCPYGPAEILDHGRYGRLVTVGKPALLAKAILEELQKVPDREMLKKRGRSFSTETCARAYRELIG